VGAPEDEDQYRVRRAGQFHSLPCSRALVDAYIQNPIIMFE
jgi:hypothetical protein